MRSTNATAPLHIPSISYLHHVPLAGHSIALIMSVQRFKPATRPVHMYLSNHNFHLLGFSADFSTRIFSLCYFVSISTHISPCSCVSTHISPCSCVSTHIFSPCSCPHRSPSLRVSELTVTYTAQTLPFYAADLFQHQWSRTVRQTPPQVTVAAAAPHPGTCRRVGETESRRA